MSLLKSRGTRVILILASVVCLAGAGYLAYDTFVVKGRPANGLPAAEDAYAKGLTLLADNPKEAAVRFDEARMLADNADKRLRTNAGKGVTQEEAEVLASKLNWVKARAIREMAYAKAQADGKPLQMSTDSSTNEQFRTYFAIPEPDVRMDAINSLRNATLKLSDQPEVVKEALRVELSLQPLIWQFAEKLCRDAVKLNEKDARAHYFLALFEFEQPILASNVSTPADKRDATRVDKAREHLEKARANGAPYWRVAGLEAAMLQWQMTETKKGKGAERAAKALDALLHGKDAALDKASRGIAFSPLSVYDFRGLLGVQLIAMKLASEGEGQPIEKAGKVKDVAQTVLDATAALCEAKGADGFLGDAGEALADALSTAQPFVAGADPTGWKKLTGEASGLMKKYPPLAAKPGTALRLADMSQRDGAADPTRRGQFQNDAITHIEAALETAKKGKPSPDELAALYATLANTKLLANKPAAEVEAILVELRKLNAPKRANDIRYLEGVLAERQGRLAAARRLLEPVVTDKDSKNTPLAGMAVGRLATITLALDDPGAAAGYLSQLAEMYGKKDNLDATSRAWLEQAAGSRDEVTAYQVVATVQSGLKRIEQLTKDKPDAPIPADMRQQVLTAAERYIKTLRAPSPPDRRARLAVARYHLLTQDRESADKLMTALSADYADSVDVLRESVGHILTPPKGKKELAPGAQDRAEERIRQFLRTNPASKGGKLYWAQWLMQTKRVREAADYLRDPRNFPDQDPVVTRLLAGALVQSGEREEAKKILGSLPADPLVDLILVQAAASKEAAEKDLQSAIGRYENNGLLRVYDAANKLNQGKFEEAAREFQAAGEYAQVRAVARTGLLRALVAFAGADPKKAAPFIGQLITDTPDDTGLYHASALASLYLDNVGEPGDNWGTKNTMYAAVNRWQQLEAKAGTPATTIGMTKVNYHLFAGNPALARQEGLRTLGQNPKDVPTLLFLAESYLTPGADQDLGKAKEFIDKAHAEAKADNPAPSLLEGALLETKGDWDGAAKLYERLTTQYADHPMPYARRIACAVALQKKGEALLWANKWVQKMPDNPAAALEQVAQLATDGAMDDAKARADEYVEKQVKAVKAEAEATKPPPAADAVEKALAGARAQATLQTAVTFFQAKKVDEAKARVTAVLKAAPDSAPALMMAGNLAMAQQDWKTAEEVYRKRLQQDARDYVAANNLAWMLAAQMNNPKEAYKLVTEVRAGKGDKPIAANRLPADFLDTLGLVYVKLNDQEKVAEMRETFEAAVNRYPTDPRMHLFLGQAYAMSGEKAKASTSLDAAVRLATDSANKSISVKDKEDTAKAAKEAKDKLGK